MQIKTTKRRRAKFSTLTVSEVRRLTPDSVEVTFAVPEELQDDFDYAPGQYVALRAEIEGQQIRRSYSLCQEPTRGEIRIAIKRDLGGSFSTWANEHLSPGDTLQVMNPSGTFVSKTAITSMNRPEELAAEAVAGRPDVHLVAFAAGSGITPIMAIARSVLAASDSSTFDLVYANRSAGDVMFAEELGDLKDRHPSRLAIHHVLSREQRINPLLTGRIDVEKLGDLLDKVLRVPETDEWFLCGPFELVQLVRDQLAARGVPEEKVRFELFTTGRPDRPEGHQGRRVEQEADGETVEIEFTLDGLTGQVTSPKGSGETVLNAALRSRSDVPFACAGGVCGTCRAKVVRGEFEMEENYALETDELEAGYVLTCQTRPTAEKLVVDYDA
ncbi:MULTISPECIES: 1,2-phenylacetyl-CoA epoxidase subunit PaaE [unclassified Nesterenkonia]|uniref:1,2-phenylacetyl-CoA epoxidase subunit PaaE n=1 Tax=unclassified Nesterenkonia TaxID=2629769 RepID=UPI00087329E9|nr:MULTISPECIES: 1,2-phenylacetyl-CoA epoxidase subunit PaaE [unclassified Nesterenkonia]MDS2173662.1 1,2-phenylacetyl-CoA epoxidase subunit PaaE [Nesterenkonia sp. CL21]OSM43733.1 phenylacetic acid degradation protein [Nesterenkonia sp. PF2B19]